MTREFGIELMTVFGMPPVEHVQLASKLGCAHISTGLTNMPMRKLGVPDWAMFEDWSLENDMVLRREFKNAMRDNGITIALGEGFGVRPGSDARGRAASLDLMAELGAERINAVSTEPDIVRGHDQLATLAEMSQARGMCFTIEFAPPNAIGTLAAAVAAVDYIGRDKAGLLLDAMHFFRSGATLDDLSEIDPAIVCYAQLCDAPLKGSGNYMQEAMFARMPPGSGELPLKAFERALPAGVPIGLEVPMLAETLAAGDPCGTAARAVAGARVIVGESCA